MALVTWTRRNARYSIWRLIILLGVNVTLAFWLAGASVIHPCKAFEPASTLDAIVDQECTHIAAVPSMIYALKNHPSYDKRRLESLISIDLAAAAIHRDILRTCLDPFQYGAMSASASFGMTESASSIAWDESAMPPIQDDSVSKGRPTPGAKVKVCAPGSKIPLKCGESGELHIGGHQGISGYLCAEEGTIYEDLRGSERWIATGDQALVDSTGAVHLLEGYGDLVMKGGTNISSASIERTLNISGAPTENHRNTLITFQLNPATTASATKVLVSRLFFLSRPRTLQ